MQQGLPGGGPFLNGEYGTMKQRMDELEAFLAEQTTEVTEYDEGLVRQLIEKITVYDNHLAFEFKSGIETEVQM